jgi:hypothetical protein
VVPETPSVVAVVLERVVVAKVEVPVTARVVVEIREPAIRRPCAVVLARLEVLVELRVPAIVVPWRVVLARDAEVVDVKMPVV